MAAQNCSVLIIEDDDAVRALLQKIVSRYCTTAEMVSDGERAIELLKTKEFSAVILDLMLPKVNGFVVAEAIQALPRPPRVIVMSAISRYFGYRFPVGTVVLQKPFDVDKLDAVMFELNNPVAQ